MIVKCPRCRKETEFAPSNPFRPFCSERCQMIDLGAWADEQYRVPVNESDPRAVNENTDDARAEGDPKPPKHRLN